MAELPPATSQHTIGATAWTLLVAREGVSASMLSEVRNDYIVVLITTYTAKITKVDL
jgi:hypothetical protein